MSQYFKYKFLFLLPFMILVHLSTGQDKRIDYVQPVNFLEIGISPVSQFSFSENQYAIAFSADGTKLFLGPGGSVQQFSLVTPFDISGGLTYETFLNTFTQERDIRGIAFSNDGLKVFVTGTRSDDIHQYTLVTPFDFTGGSTFNGTYIDFNLAAAHDVDFNADGTKMFVLGGQRKWVNQYSLSTPFDITSGVTIDPKYVLPSTVTSANALSFDPYGTKMYILGLNDSNVLQFDLTTPYNVSTGVTPEGEVLDVSTEESSPLDMEISPDGSQFYIIGFGATAGGEKINQYGIDPIVEFSEVSANNGGIDGSVRLSLIGDTFVNAGSSLLSGTHYSISNLPIGLIPSLVVAGDGSTALFTLTGNASSHVNTDDLSSLEFTFTNAAFLVEDAVDIEGAISTQSNFGIDFRDPPFMSYSFGGFDVSSDVSFDEITHLVNGQDVSPQAITFNNDGTKMYILGGIGMDVNQYTLTSPFDLTSGVTFDETPFSVAGQETSPRGLTFNNDGTKMYVVGGSGLVSQYSLSNPFDITSGVTFDMNAFDHSGEELGATGIDFTTDGSKMFIIGFSGDDINQYNLSTPFNTTSGVTYDGSSISIGTIETNPSDIVFNPSGTKMLIIGYTSDAIHQFSLSNRFDVTSGVVYDGTPYAVSDEETLPNGLAFSDNGTKMFVTGSAGDKVNQYTIDPMGYKETSANSGAVTGAIRASLTGETFSNAGGELVHLTDYTITNLPKGLQPILVVSESGEHSALFLAGKASSNQNADDISNLTISFSSSAFEDVAVANITNAVDAVTGFDIDFSDNPILTYGFSGAEALDLNNTTTFQGDFYSFDNTTPRDLTFSGDGLKLFILGAVGNEVNQYTLSDPFDIRGDVNLDATFVVTNEETNPTGITFSQDGMKMYVVGARDRINQYSLSNAFDVSTGVTVDANPFAVTEDGNTVSIKFSQNGMKMFLLGLENDAVYQYSLTSPFNTSTGITYDNTSFSVASEDILPMSLAFNSDGSQMFVLGFDGKQINNYTLANPFDLTTGVMLVGADFSINSTDTAPSGILLSPNDDKLYFVGETGDKVYQYALSAGGYSETFENTGAVEGSLFLKINGDTFTNAGGNLTATTDYQISNLPTSLIPNLAVSADGLSAILTLSGSASPHSKEDDLSSLQFNFEDNAFTNVSADNVINATNFSSGFGIDFIDIVSAPTDISLNSTSINENESIGTVIGELSTTDEDAGETYTYTFVSGNGSMNNASFTIDGDQLKSAELFDFETKASYSIRVNTNDGNGGDFGESFTITVSDVSESPTAIALDNTSINENESIGTVVGALSTTDEDAGETYTYTFVSGNGSTDNASFTIDGDQLKSAELFDFETKDSYSIRINTNDGNGGDFEESFIITVSDVSESPTAIALDNTSINENESIGTVVGTLSTTDEDAAETYTYTFVSGNGSADNASFTIDGDQLKSAELFDFETKDSYSIRINTNDGNGGDFEESFIIAINDIVEEIVWDGSAWSNVTGPTASDDVVINGTYTYFGNGSFDCNDLTVTAAGSIYVNAEGTLEVFGDIANAGLIRILNGASLITYDGKSVTGNDIEIRRNTRYADGKYSFVGTPVKQNVELTASDLGNNVYIYDERASAVTDDLARWDLTAESDQLIPGRGYTQANKQLLIFNGIPNTGTITHFGTYENDGWQLVSNPYAAAIFIDDFLDANMNTTDAIYIWDDNGSDTGRGSNNDYIVANKTAATDISGTDNASRWNEHIGSAQGFFVQLDGVAGNITFTEEMRVTGNNSDNNFFRKVERSNPILRLSLTHQEGLIRQTIVGWNEAVPNHELAEGYDAKVFNTNSDYQIFTVKANAPLAIQTVNSNVQEIPLGIRIAEAGTYSISFKLEHIKGSYFLLDHESGEYVDMSAGTHTFSAVAGHHPDRFVITKTSGVLALEEQNINVYAFNKVLHIERAESQRAQYQLYNLSGKHVLNISTSGATKVNLSFLTDGVYLVFDGERTHKVLLK